MLQRGPVVGSEQHQVTVVLDTTYMVVGKGIAEGSTVELHWRVVLSWLLPSLLAVPCPRMPWFMP